MSQHHPRIRLLLVLAPLLIAAWVSPAAATNDDASPGLASFEGRYDHVGGARDRRGLYAAIDRVVDRMSIFIRPIARGRIRSALEPEPYIAVEVPDADRVRLTLGGWRSPVMPADGAVRTVSGPDGSSTRFSVRHHAGRLYTRAETSRGVREIWMTPGSDRRRLTMQIRVSADPLPAPIEYTLTFARGT